MAGELLAAEGAVEEGGQAANTMGEDLEAARRERMKKNAELLEQLGVRPT